MTRAGFTIEVYANRAVESALQPPAARLSAAATARTAAARARRRQPADLAHPDSESLRSARSEGATSMRSPTKSASAMEFMSANFGPPPLKTLTVSPIPGTFGQGFPGLDLSVDARLSEAIRVSGQPMHTESQRRFFSELLHAHETAHQWWGNLVTSASYQDDWLMEALANYSSHAVPREEEGTQGARRGARRVSSASACGSAEGNTIESAGPIVWGTRLISSHATNSWRAIMYEKGAWIIHMLRVRMGDAAFLKMLNAVAQRNRYGRVSTDEFSRLAAEFLPAGQRRSRS